MKYQHLFYMLFLTVAFGSEAFGQKSNPDEIFDLDSVLTHYTSQPNRYILLSDSICKNNDLKVRWDSTFSNAGFALKKCSVYQSKSGTKLLMDANYWFYSTITVPVVAMLFNHSGQLYAIALDHFGSAHTGSMERRFIFKTFDSFTQADSYTNPNQLKNATTLLERSTLVWLAMGKATPITNLDNLNLTKMELSSPAKVDISQHDNDNKAGSSLASAFSFSNGHLQKKPSFPGGEKAQKEFIKKNRRPLTDPFFNDSGWTISVSFVVDKDGKILNAAVESDPGGGMGEEALRLVNSMPDWIPGEAETESVFVKCKINIRFKKGE